MTSPAVDAADALLQALTFQAGYNTTLVSIGAALLGANAGAIGTFVTLRRRALVSDAMSHATLPGLAIAFIVMALATGDGRFLPGLMLGAVATAVLGLLAIDAITRHTRLDEDVAIGAVLSTFFGAGVVLMTVIQSMDVGGQAGISGFLLGATAGMRLIEAQTIALSAAVAGLLVMALRRAFTLVCFDPTFAAATGVDVRRTDLMMIGLLLVVIVIGLQVAGLVLVVALAIVPPVAARFWTDRVGTMTLVAAGMGAVSGHVGAALSAAGPGLPTGPLIVLTGTAIFIVSMLVGPARGVFPGLLGGRSGEAAR
ncbi:metal ABC transporter permease [Chthonobacter rhizosphaerae]|uniref:metal ABC transporter permease n=1 Tax=Chthonobacter rhizosphaerae TaxID=2735553 RepID=UPI0015EF0AB4|nr:metal ABC transporter permease [Chthonobacter rhizosphaerae]